MLDNNDYNGSSIEILEGLEAVRKRPGMYIGSTNSRGLHHLIWEVIDNSVDESLAGFCSHIWVTLKTDGSISVRDDGRGIPVDLQPKLKIPAERVIFTVLHAGGKFNNNNYKVSGGLHGVGASVVNALSKWLEVEICRNGEIYKDRYENGGNPVTQLINGLLPVVGKSKETGTTTTFMPDDTIMETIDFKPEIIKKRLKELSYLNKGLNLYFEDEKINEQITFHQENGIVGFIKDINISSEVIHDDIIYVAGKSDKIEIEIAMQYTNSYTENILSFCNNINTVEGGTHVTGFKTALTRTINQYAKELSYLKEKDENLDGRDIRNGLTAIILIKHPNPQYEGQTKTKLGNTDTKGAVDEVFGIESQKFFDRNIETLKVVIENAMKSYKIRKAEEKVRTNIMADTKFIVNSKLASCISKNPDVCELFLVEGDSAGGSAKQGRDRHFQAILPLWGKMLNVEKVGFDKVYGNEKLLPVVAALGTGIGPEFDISKMRYSKVIIMADADVDGSHIRTLFLTFFYRYMPELIYSGKIYIGMPPLYKITVGKTSKYLFDDRDFDKYIKDIGDKKYDVQRYKGLGEMNPNQLWETSLNPKIRFLKKVTIENAASADNITSILMGSKVPPRKAFIYSESINANLDI